MGGGQSRFTQKLIVTKGGGGGGINQEIGIDTTIS